MKFEKNSIATQPEILKRKLGGELLVPVTVDLEGKDVVKGGSPIDATGKAVNDGTAVGILLYDVTSDNPNGSLIKAFATVNLANIEKNAEITVAESVKTALSDIIFE